MKATSEIKQIMLKLEFHEEWFDSGFVSTEKLKELWSDFQNGDDPNKEHYRWKVFTEYLENKEMIADNKLRELYQLGEIDADSDGMGMAMRITILQRKDCPSDLVKNALNSKEKSLIKVAEKKLKLEYT